MHHQSVATGKEAANLRRRGFSMRETCHMLGIGMTTGWKLVKDGKLSTVKVCGRTVITAASIDRLMADPGSDA